jgi:MOSC domain-containing protein YiiM
MKIIGLYSGKLSNIGPKRSLTGIFKQTTKQVLVDELGIIGDIQADERFHGGVEKALHQYALSGYEKIIKRYPLLHKIAKPGMMGENLSVTNMQDSSVCIGDIYQLGNVIIQVSSPRIPCWKIDAKFKQPELNKFVAQHRITGWYYRILQGGEISTDYSLSLISRENPDLSIQDIMKVIYGNVTETTAEQAAQAIGLDPEWKQRLSKKYDLS